MPYSKTYLQQVLAARFIKDQPGKDLGDIAYHDLARRKTGKYIRFGKWHKAETSKNGATGVIFDGVSAFETKWSPEKNRWIMYRNHPNDSSMFSLFEAAGKKKLKPYLVSGLNIGVGPDGEPLLKNIKLIQELTLYDLMEDGDKLEEYYDL